MEDKLRIGGITPLTSVDYPGELAAVVFCQGCPWRCRYCHNGGLLPSRTDHPIPWHDLHEFLRRRRGLLDAVVFSGGEPTLQRALPDALREVRLMGYKTGLHTAGIYPQALRSLLHLVDWVGLDIKSTESGYPTITGIEGSGEQAWESARLLINSGLRHEIRITVHPRLLPVEQLSSVIARLTHMGAESIVLQSCHTEHTLSPELESCSPEDFDYCHPWVHEGQISLRR